MRIKITPVGTITTTETGETLTGKTALATFDRHVEKKQEQRQRFAREHPKDWARFCRAREYVDAPAAPQGTPEGHAPRSATNARARGSKRGMRASSSSSDDPEPDPNPRICEWCGGPIDPRKRRDARHCKDAHKSAARRARKKDENERALAPAPVKACKCGCCVSLEDPDGDRVCSSCGRYANPTHLTSPNGYEAVFALMITDADGQYRRLHNKRRQGTGRWGGLVTRLPSDPRSDPKLGAIAPGPTIHYRPPSSSAAGGQRR